MTKGSVAVLEVGSQKITCIIGQRGVNGTFLLKSISESEYDGYADCSFYDMGSLARSVEEVVKTTVKNAKMSIDKLYVSVPGEFSTVRTKEHTLAFPRKRRIKKRDVDELLSAFELNERSQYVITDVSAVYYILDDNRRVANPVGAVSFKLGAYLSYMLADKAYVRQMTNVCKSVGVKRIDFISESIAECLYLFSEEEREYRNILIDIGYLSTNVMVLFGGGVLLQQAFSYGGGYITLELMKRSIVSSNDFEKFDLAEKLKRKINLGYDINVNGTYHLVVNDTDFMVPLQVSNFTVKSCLEVLADEINKILSSWPIDLRVNIPIYITGGGINYIRGAKEYLASLLEMQIIDVAPKVPFMNKPDESACLSILNEALKREEK